MRVGWQRNAFVLAFVALSCALSMTRTPRAAAQTMLLELEYTPVERAQVALWIEDASSRFLATVSLTEAVAYRGIGNRPGASQFNSGYRWPYGRREGVLPIWAHRRAAASGAKSFPRVIYQMRPEGYASKLTFDQSPDWYYCLQFDPTHSTRDELDAVSCASIFSSDKGRYITADDVAAGYAEPFDEGGGNMGMTRLPLESLYPPRMDVPRCTTMNICFDHEDVAHYAADARAVMPEIDSITHATAPGGTPQRVLFDVPAEWSAGAYRAWLEVHVEGDYNAHWNAMRFPTPQSPPERWDSYSSEYGYPYRGQPSIAYEVAFVLDGTPGVYATDAAAGRSSWDIWTTDYGKLEPISTRADDPDGLADSDGSGIDRLRVDANGKRFTVRVSDAGAPTPMGERSPVGAVGELRAMPASEKLRSHEWVSLHFTASVSELPIHDYEVRVATVPIMDETSFIRDGRPAKNATDDPEGATALMLPAATQPGQPIDAMIGNLVPLTHYYVGVRATDQQNRHGPIATTEVTTTQRSFATVTPCFIATAAYGSQLAREVGALRRVRDRYLLSNALGQQLVAAYYRHSPTAAAFIARHPRARALTRALLSPLTAAAARLER